jgi:hypothetical protein
LLLEDEHFGSGCSKKAGWLEIQEKKAGLMLKYRKRWFVLQAGVLYKYKKQV